MSSGDVSEPATTDANSSNKYVVVLPCPPDQFREFVSGLLGKPQTISKRITGPFEIGKADIENFIILLFNESDSRMKQPSYNSP